MVTLPLGIHAYKRDFPAAPEIELVNRYVEKAPTNLIESIRLIARPGTTSLEQFGAGPIRGCYYKDGLFGGDLFVVSGDTLFRYDGTTTTAITGTLPGSGNPYVTWMKGIGYEYLFIADGTDLQYYDAGGDSLGAVAMPDMNETAKALTNLNGFVLVSVLDTQKVYFIRPGEITIAALDFLSKESNPDPVNDLLTVGDRALVMGAGSTESWYATGDVDAPLAPTAGLAFARGVVDGTPVVVRESVIVVGNDGVVYEVGAGVRQISTNGIEERIRTRLRFEQGLP